MSDEQDWFVVERARALAMIALTRRDDVVVTADLRDDGVDFSAYIVKDDQLGPIRRFGVYLYATREAIPITERNRLLRPVLAALSGHPHFLPACLFHFTMDDDQGCYTWIAEPWVSGDGVEQVRIHKVPDCRPLDRAALDDIVDGVSRWYDAYFARQAVTAP